MTPLIIFFSSSLIIFLVSTYFRWKDAVKMSPYKVRPHVYNMVLDEQIYLNPFTWDEEVLVHEMAHKIRGKGPRDQGYDDPDHDPLFWETYDKLMKKYNIPYKHI